MNGFRSWSHKFWSRTQEWCLRAPHVKKLLSLKVSSPKLSQHRVYPSYALQVIKSKSLVTWTPICRKILSISSQSLTWAKSLNALTPPSNHRKQRPAPSTNSCLLVGLRLLIIRIIRHRWWPLTRLRWSAAAAPTFTIASSTTQQRTSCGQLHRWLVVQTASRPASTVKSRGLAIRSATSVSLLQPISASEALLEAVLKHLITPTQTTMTARTCWMGHGPSLRKALAPWTIVDCLLLEPCLLRTKLWEILP